MSIARTKPTLRRVAVAVCLAVSACTAVDLESNGHPEWDPHGLVPSSGPDHELIADVVEAAHNEGSPFSEESIAFHREVFANGEVTFADYERAMHAVAGCVRALGYNILGPLLGLEGGLHIEPGVDPNILYTPFLGIDPPAEFTDDASSCQALWQWRVQRVWLTKTAPTGQEIQIWLDAAWDCARERGFPLSSPPTEQEAVEAAAQGCEPWNALPDR